MTARCLVGTLLGLLSLTACGSPAPDAEDHRDAVVTAAESAVGSARTATITAQAWQRGNATTAYAVVVLREAATSIDGAAGELSVLTPPAPGDAVQERATTTLTEADEAVTALRVAVEREDAAAAAEAAGALSRSADDLEKIAEDLG